VTTVIFRNACSQEFDQLDQEEKVDLFQDEATVMQDKFDMAISSFASLVPLSTDRELNTFIEKLAYVSAARPPKPGDFRSALVARFGSSWSEIAYFSSAAQTITSGDLLVIRDRRTRLYARRVLGLRAIGLSLPPGRLLSLIRSAIKRQGQENATTGVTPEAREVGSSVILLNHQGPSYGKLYNWSQYFDPDPEGLLNEARIRAMGYEVFSWKRSNARTLASSFFAVCRIFRSALKLSRQFPRGFQLIALTEILRLSLEVAVALRSIRATAPRPRIALFAYDMLVPPSLSLALWMAGIVRIATLERPTVYLVGLPVLVDHYFVPNQEIAHRLREAETVSAGQLHVVGHWRTDWFFDARAENSACDVLVQPYHVSAELSQSKSEPFVSTYALEHFVDDVLLLAEAFPNLRFLIRTKTPEWTGFENAQGLLTKISQLPNVTVDTDYSVEGRTYFVAAGARVIIGKYSSFMDEALAFGLPVVVHNFTRFGSREFRDGCLAIDWSWVTQSSSEFRARVRSILDTNFVTPPPRDPLCDGEVKVRIRDVIYRILDAKQS